MTFQASLLTRVFLTISFLLLTACGFDSSSGDQASIAAQEELFIDGGGIKGPLAFASVELYALDTRFEQLYDSDAPLATATTNAYAQIKGLRVPKKVPAPYILVIDGTNAIDLNTNVAPVINKMITVITQQALDARQAVYATPYTTLVYQMLRRGINSLDQQMAQYSEVVSKALGFGMPAEVDIFTTSPIITKATDSAAEQQLAINYRGAIEALSALLHEASIASPGSVSSDKYLELLAIDLRNDGVVNGVFDGSLGESIDIGIFLQEPMDLLIPNTDYFVRDILSLLDAERSVVGGSSNVYIFSDLLVLNLRPALLDSTIDYPQEVGYSEPVGITTNTLLATGFIASTGGEILFQNDINSLPLGVMTVQTMQSAFKTTSGGGGLGNTSIVNDPDPRGSHGRVLRTKVAADKQGGGSNWHTTFKGVDEVYFAYDLYLDPNHTFSMGVKLHGIYHGDLSEVTGCGPADDGASYRLMVFTPDAYGRISGGVPGTNALSTYKYTYQYRSSHPGGCGETDIAEEPLGSGVPAGLIPGQWNRIEFHLKMNTETGSVANTDGLAELYLNGVKVASDRQQWRRAGKTWKFDGLLYQVFHGGGDSAWAVPVDTFYYTDNFIVSTSPITH